MSDLVVTKTIYRPLGQAALAQFIEQAAKSDPEVELTPQAIKDALGVKIACRSLTRLQAVTRTQMRDTVLEWASDATDLPREEIDLAKVDFQVAAKVVIRLQAADILSCLVWEECAGIEFGQEPPPWFGDIEVWTATKDTEDWVDAPDWLFTPLLDLAWQANPQLSLGAGQVPFA